MASYSEDKLQLGETIIKIACVRGHVPAEVVDDMTKWSEWWKSLSEERKNAIIKDCTAYLGEHSQKRLKKEEEFRKEQPARKWLFAILPAILAIHSISYVPKWWYSVLIFIGAALAFRLLLVVWDLLKGRL